MFWGSQWSCASEIGPTLRSQQTPVCSQRQVVRAGCGAHVLQIQCNYCTCSLSWSNVTKPADNVIKLVGIRKTASFVAHRFFFCMLYNQMYIHAAYYIFSYLAKRLWVWWGMKPWLENGSIQFSNHDGNPYVTSVDWGRKKEMDNFGALQRESKDPSNRPPFVIYGEWCLLQAFEYLVRWLQYPSPPNLSLTHWPL